MDFYQNNQGQGGQPESRPGFTEQPMNFGQSSSQAPAPSQNSYSGGNYQNQAPQQQQPQYTSTGGGGNNGGNWQNRQGGNNGGNWQNRQGGGGNWNRNGGGGGGGGNWKNRQQPKPLTPEELEKLKLPKTAVITGNGRAPDQLKPLIAEAGNILAHHGYTIRASCMDGFDKMVMETIPGVELHIPWKNFNQVQGEASYFSNDECKEFAKRYLPEWSNIKEVQQSFYAKNVRLILGKYLKQPCQIVIIWSEDGCEGPATRTMQSGQAGHVAAIAKAMNIPVINLSNPNAIPRLRQFLES